MSKAIESIGRWGITHNAYWWILGGIAAVLVAYVVWDCYTEFKPKKGYRRG